MGQVTKYFCDMCGCEHSYYDGTAVKFIWHGSRDEVYWACERCLPKTPGFFKRFMLKFFPKRGSDE